MLLPDGERNHYFYSSDIGVQHCRKIKRAWEFVSNLDNQYIYRIGINDNKMTKLHLIFATLFFSVAGCDLVSDKPGGQGNSTKVSSSSSGKLIYTRYDGRRGFGEIWSINVDGSNAQRISGKESKKPGSYHSAVFSPDGEKIAYVAGARLSGNIYIMNANGTAAKNITKGKKFGGDTGIYRHPKWSPDGKKIAFIGGRFSSEVYIIDADGSNGKKLTGIKGTSHSQVWSPDGKRIAFVATSPMPQNDGSMKYSLPNIWIVDLDGSNLRKMTSDNTKDYSPRWSPSGPQIAYVSQSVKSQSKNVRQLDRPEIYLVGTDHPGEHNITNDKSSEDHSPAWSPDGTKIAFVSRRKGPPVIYTMYADGTRVESLTKATWGPMYSSLQWAPDGKRILYLDKQKLGVINTDGSNQKTLEKYGRVETPVWAP